MSEERVPALYEHCVRAYETMLAEATPVTRAVDIAMLEDSNVQEASPATHVRIVVYEGFLTQLVTGKLNLSVPYYSTIRKSLIRMGCIRQLRRGGGNTPSQWELIHAPTLDAFENADGGVPKTANQSKFETMKLTYDQQIQALASRVTELEDFRTAILEFLTDKFGTEAQEDD